MSIEAIAWAFDRDELGTAHRFVLMVLANCYNRDEDACFPSQEYIARKTSLTRSYVNRIMAELERDGYVNMVPRVRKNGSATSHSYQLNLPKPETERKLKDPPPPGFIYVFAAKDKVKVGISRDVHSRRASVETATGERTTLVKAWSLGMREARNVELAVLESLKRYRLRGEWLSCAADVAVEAVEAACCRLSAHPVCTEYTPPVDSVHTPKQDSKPDSDSTSLSLSVTDLFDGGGPPKKKRTNDRRRIADDWEPDEAGLAYARGKGFDDDKVRQLIVACRDYHLKHGTLIAGAVGLAATWRTWCNNEVKFSEERKRRYGNKAGRDQRPWDEVIYSAVRGAAADMARDRDRRRQDEEVPQRGGPAADRGGDGAREAPDRRH